MSVCTKGMFRRIGRRATVLERLEDRSLLSGLSTSAIPHRSAPVKAELVELRWVNETKERHSTSRSSSNQLIQAQVNQPKASGNSDSSEFTAAVSPNPERAGLTLSSLVNNDEPVADGNNATPDSGTNDSDGEEAGVEGLPEIFFAEWASGRRGGKERLTPSWLSPSLYGQTGGDKFLAMHRGWGSSATTAVRPVNGQRGGEKNNGRTSLLDLSGARLLDYDSRSGPFGNRHEWQREVTVPLGFAGTLDWERLEHDLHQFLARVGGIPSVPVGAELDSAIPRLIAIVLIFWVAHESARRDGWWRKSFARYIRDESKAPPHPTTGPVGPWPQGLA